MVFHHDAGASRNARDAVVGANDVARMALDRGRPFVGLARPAIVNGAAGVIVTAGERLIGVCGITVSDGRIAELDLVTDPEKLQRVRWQPDKE